MRRFIWFIVLSYQCSVHTYNLIVKRKLNYFHPHFVGTTDEYELQIATEELDRARQRYEKRWKKWKKIKETK